MIKLNQSGRLIVFKKFITGVYKIIFYVLNIKIFKNMIFDALPERYIFVENQSVHFILDKKDKVISKAIYRKGFYDFDFLQKALEICKKRDYLIDVGANLGSISIPAIKNNYFKMSYAFEIDKLNLKHLKLNTILNNLEDKIVIENLAVFSKSNQSLSVKINKYNYGDTKITLTHENDNSKVKSITLDQYFKNNKKIYNSSLIFMDIQGSEIHALKGANLFLKKTTPIVLEMDPSALEKLGTNFFDLQNLLKEYRYFYILDNKNFKVKIRIDHLEKLYNYCMENREYANILFV